MLDYKQSCTVENILTDVLNLLKMCYTNKQSIKIWRQTNMKVCLLNDSFPPVIDGVANVVMNYAKILQEKELAEVIVGTPRYPDTDYSVYPYRVEAYHSFDTTKIIKGYRAGNPLDIKEIHNIAEFSPDIIHSHCPVSSTILARVLRGHTDAPIVFTYHTKFDVDIAKALKTKFAQKETIRALVANIEACDEVWVVSQGAGENLKSLGYEGEYRVVNNGVDFAKGRVEASIVSEVTKDYDLPEGVPVFLFVGRIIKYKGLPLILDALRKLDAEGMDFRMVFVGSGPDSEELKAKALEYGLLDKKCLFVGPVYDRQVLRAWNTRADLFLFPSTYDTNGIVVREAAACGLASVLIKGSCAAEGITHGRNGYMIDENAEALYSLLSTICTDMERVKQVGQNAMDEIYISWEDSVQAAYDRYLQVLDNKKSGMYLTKRQIVKEKFKDFTYDKLDDAKQFFNNQKRIYDNMLDNVEEFSQGIVKDVIEEFRDTFHDIDE